MGGSRRILMGSDRQTISESGSWARFCFWACWARVFTAKSMCYISIAILALFNSQRGRDEVDSQMVFI